MQALLLGHSGLMVHSGLQFGGLPMYVGRQEHDGDPPMSLHWELRPQGVGTQGSLYGSFGSSVAGAETRSKRLRQKIQQQ